MGAQVLSHTEIYYIVFFFKFPKKMADAKIQWEQCLASSGRNPSKCKKFEAELKKLEVSRGENYCIQETIDLMHCTNKGKTCGTEFFSMRECNRAGGSLFSK